MRIAHTADAFVSAHPTVPGQKLRIDEWQSYCPTRKGAKMTEQAQQAGEQAQQAGEQAQQATE